MKKRLTALLLAAALVAGVFTGCGENEETAISSQQGQETAAQFAYKASYSPLDMSVQKLNYINSFCISDNLIYFGGECMVGTEPMTNEITGEPYIDESTGEALQAEIYESRLFVLDLNTKAVTQLEGYTVTEVPDGMLGSAYLNHISPGADGTIWVTEYVYTYSYDLPEDFDAETQDPWQYYVDGGTKYYLRQFDAQGNCLQTITPEFEEGLYIGEFMIDASGTLYGTDWTNIYIFDSTGKQTATISSEEGSYGIGNLVSFTGGRVGVMCWTEEGNVLRLLDPETKAFGEDITLAFNASQIYPGTDEYLYLYSYNDAVYGFNEETGEGEKLFAWLDCDVNSNNINQFVVREDGTVIAVESNYSEKEGRNTYNLVELNQVDASTLPKKQELILACYYLDWNMRTDIIEFNKSHDDVRIVVKDYSEYNTEEDYSAGIQKLNTEILSGVIPDILSVDSQIPLKQYAGKGLMSDLWPLIDNDPEISRDDLMTHLFESLSIDGKLYQITDTFSIMTAAASRKTVGDRDSWTFQEMRDVLSGMEEDCTIFGIYDTKSEILTNCVSRNVDSFIDWTTGQCYFDSEEFVDMLEFANTFPAEFDYENFDWENQESEYYLLQNGKQLMTRAGIYSFDEIQYQNALHGGEAVYIGFPSNSGNGSVFQIYSGLAISASCKNVDAAWSFVRQYLTEEYQTSEYMWEFPTNKNSFEAYAKQKMTPEYTTDPETGEQIEISNSSYYIDEETSIEIKAMTQEEYDQFMHLYESCSSFISYDEEINEIIVDEAAPFFDGQKTAEETASLIQNRVGLFVSEQG